jgi:hypothetical protein
MCASRPFAVILQHALKGIEGKSSVTMKWDARSGNASQPSSNHAVILQSAVPIPNWSSLAVMQEAARFIPASRSGVTIQFHALPAKSLLWLAKTNQAALFGSAKP